MNFLRSKLSIIFVFLCFSSGLGMGSKLLTVDSIEAIKSELAKKYLVRVERTDGRLIHEGVSTSVGIRVLDRMLSMPVALSNLKERQEILKELVALNPKDFENLNISFKKVAILFQEFAVLANQIEQLEPCLNKMQDELGMLPDIDLRMAFMALALCSMLGTVSLPYFAAYTGLSMGFCALDQYFWNGAISNRALLIYIFSGIVGKLCKGKDTILAAGNSVFAMDDQRLTSLLIPNACASGDALTCAGESCFCLGQHEPIGFAPQASQSSGWNLAGYVPSFVKSFASGISLASNALFIGNGLLNLTTLTKRIAYKKAQSDLTDKKKKAHELSDQFVTSLDDLCRSIKQNNFKLSGIALDEQADFNTRVRCFATLDVLLGLSSLIRESNKQTPGSKRFKMGFVDFIEPDQNKNRFEMHINNVCHFLKFKPEKEYKTAEMFADFYMFTNLDFVVSENNEWAINFPQINQINFLFIYAQMLLAHTFGIVWGESAQMKFIDISKINFVSDSEKAVSSVIFPAV